jgi:1-phosphatidylinositol-4-phosphate 5-kinase
MSYQVSIQPSVSQKAACTLLHGILQTYEAGDDIFESELMDPKYRKTRTETTVGGDEIVGTVKVYRPVLFQRIRSLIGMTEPSYLQCLDFEKEGMCCLADSDSKSGQSFWISKNEKLVLKTIKQYECSNLQRILDGYLSHLKECSGRSCISTVLGLYRVTLKNGSKRYFMASRNVYPASTHSDGQPPVGSINANIESETRINNDVGSSSMKHTKFDLKGSTVGRSAAHTSSVMKDLDLMSSGVLFPLGEVRSTLLRVLERDVLFLRKHSLMDYSLLVAVEAQTHTHTQAADTSGQGRAGMDSRFSSRVSVTERDR